MNVHSSSHPPGSFFSVAPGRTCRVYRKGPNYYTLNQIRNDTHSYVRICGCSIGRSTHTSHFVQTVTSILQLQQAQRNSESERRSFQPSFVAQLQLRQFHDTHQGTRQLDRLNQTSGETIPIGQVKSEPDNREKGTLTVHMPVSD